MLNNLIEKKILIVAPHFRVFIKELTEHYNTFVNSVFVLVPSPRLSNLALQLPILKNNFHYLNWGPQNEYRSGNIHVLLTKFFGVPVKPISKRVYHLIAKSCLNTIENNKLDFDLVHTHFLFQGLAGVSIKNKKNVPFVLSTHGSDVYDLPFRNAWYRNLAKSIIKKSDHVIAVSNFTRNKLIGLGANQTNLSIIPNGFDENHFQIIPQEDARVKLGLPLGEKIVLSVGSLTPVKGHIHLIDSMVSVKKANDKVILIIIGSGPLESYLREQILKKGLSTHVRLVGWKDHRELPLWINSADLFVLPSLREGFPTVLPEAMACGKPIVATKVGGNSEAITNSELGILVKPHNCHELSNAILHSLERKWNERVISDNAKQYSWKNAAKRISEIYSLLI
jgi:glycosyltransferase involved in cell wall biosynthesis